MRGPVQLLQSSSLSSQWQQQELRFLRKALLCFPTLHGRVRGVRRLVLPRVLGDELRDAVREYNLSGLCEVRETRIE